MNGYQASIFDLLKFDLLSLEIILFFDIVLGSKKIGRKECETEILNLSKTESIGCIIVTLLMTVVWHFQVEDSCLHGILHNCYS